MIDEGRRPLEQAIPGALYSEPATLADLAEAEQHIGMAIPEELRAIYLETGSIREPLGNAAYLLPLKSAEGGSSLVQATLFFRDEWPHIVPQGPDFSEFIVFGSSSADVNWAIRKSTPHDLIGYHHHMQDEVEDYGCGILDLFARDFAELQDLASCFRQRDEERQKE